jgi:hypothetical protein
MKKCLFALFLVCSASVLAQEVVATQGDSYTNSNGSVDFTIGEVVINTESNGATDITQGFHQTNWNFVGLDDYAPLYEVSVFPNPVETSLNIKAPSFENVTYTIYDATGRIVAQNKLVGDLTIVEVSALAPGAYSLILLGKNQNKLKTFKLVKIH